MNADGLLAAALVEAIQDPAVVEALAAALAPKLMGAATSAPNAAADRWMTMEEAAGYLGFERKTPEGWRTQGIGPKAEKAGRAVRYSRVDLDEWVRGKGGRNGSA